MPFLNDIPHLLLELHPTKNKPLGISPGDLGVWSVWSERVVWWRCHAGPDHEWKCSVRDRTRGKACPFCKNQRASVTNSLASLAPAVAREWHPTKNGARRPRDVVSVSTKKAWWKCPKGPDHTWQTTPRNRVLLRQGCPFCVGMRPSVTNSLAALAPALAAEWHRTKNGTLTPHDVTTGSIRRVWWRCAKHPSHEWLAALASRVKQKTGCPFCSGHRIFAKNSLAARRPDLAAQWHPTKNAPLLPTQVGSSVKRTIWWKCPKGPDHEWEASINYRSKFSKCPFCNGRRFSVTNSLARVYPKLARQWHPTKNGSLTPETVSAFLTKHCFWQCAFGHAWRARIYPRVYYESGCPHCMRRRNHQLMTRKTKERIRLASYEGARPSRARRG
jgi:hypothetical protein